MLIRRENAAFISPANSSVIREAERWREETRGLQRREDRQRRGGAGEVVRSTGIKQTELVPCDKNHRSRNLTGTIDFFFPPPPPHSSVFCLPLPLLKAQQSERPPETLGSLYLLSIFLFFLFSPPPAYMFSFFLSFTISYNFCPTILLFFPGNFHPADPSPLRVSPER